MNPLQSERASSRWETMICREMGSIPSTSIQETQLRFFFDRSLGDKSKPQPCLGQFSFIERCSHFRHIQLFQAFAFLSQRFFNSHLSSLNSPPEECRTFEDFFETDVCLRERRGCGANDDDLILSKKIMWRELSSSLTQSSQVQRPLQHRLYNLPCVCDSSERSRKKTGMLSPEVAHQFQKNILPGSFWHPKEWTTKCLENSLEAFGASFERPGIRAYQWKTPCFDQ